MTAPFSNCRFRECDLPGQCRDEGKCHHPAVAAANGAEPIYQVMINDKWVDSTAAEYAVVSNTKRIVYAAPVADSAMAKDAEIARLNAIINTPHTDDFLKAVSIEGEHQRQRWGSEHDAGKAPADWFWLVGYLAGKALHAHAAGNVEKAEHHIITTAAACANWHRAMFGKTDMRPGIDGEAALNTTEQSQ